jgi:hypothetical protein
MIRQLVVSVAVLLILSSCSRTNRISGSEKMVVDQLFFGRNVKGIQAVSDSAWSNFLADIVTPRFPKGFTFWPATGQWRYDNGQIEQEASFVVELLHPPSIVADSNIIAITTAYKLRFHQESVLRVSFPVRASF